MLVQAGDDVTNFTIYRRLAIGSIPFPGQASKIISTWSGFDVAFTRKSQLLVGAFIPFASL